MTRNTLLLGILLLFNSFLFSQDNCQLSISGKVIDEHDQSALSFSNIYILETHKGVVADLNGDFSLRGLCAGTYQLVVSHVGCESDTISIELKESIVRNFYLEHHLEELQAVNIDGESFKEKQSSNRIAEIDLMNRQSQSFADVLESVNGVQSLKTGANISKPVINGFSANRIQIINGGLTHESQQWGDEHAPEIDPFMASDYTVIKGASALKYGGGAFGGFVLVEPKALKRTAGIDGQFDAVYATNNRLMNSSLMLEGGLKKLPSFSWRAQISGKQSAAVQTPNYYQSNTATEALNFSATAAYFQEKWKLQFNYSQFNEDIGIFSGAHIGNLTDLRRLIEGGDPAEVHQENTAYKINRPKQSIQHESVVLDWRYYFNELNQLTVKIGRQFNIREEFDKEQPRNRELAALNIPEMSLSLESYSADVLWKHEKADNLRIESGLNLRNKENRVNSFIDFIPDYQSNELGVFSVIDKKFNQWELEGGVRFNYKVFDVNKVTQRGLLNYNLDFSTFHASLGAKRRLFNRLNAEATYTYSERAPEINELFGEGLHHGTASIENGSPNLLKEKMHEISMGFKFEMGKLSSQTYLYSKYIKDFIYLKAEGLELTIRGAFPAFSWSNTDAFINGIDQRFNYTITEGLSLESNWNFLWANNLTENSYLIFMPSNRTSNSLNYRFRIKEKSKMSIRLGQQYVFRQYRFNENEEIAPPPEAYQLFHASVLMPVLEKEKLKTQLSIEIRNLLNTKYRDYLNRFRYFTDAQGRNINIHLKINF